MNGSEVNELMNFDSRASLDDGKTNDQLVFKVNVFDVAFHNLEAAQTSADDIVSEGSFSFIPFPCGAFVDLVTEAFMALGQDRSKKFLDVGCGIGTKVILACSLLDAYGIEHNPKLVELARSLGLNRVGLADALTFDNYAAFDVVYYYRPFYDSEKYRRFETLIHSQMKPGAIVAPMHTEYDWDNQSDIERLTRFLFRKKVR